MELTYKEITARQNTFNYNITLFKKGRAVMIIPYDRKATQKLLQCLIERHLDIFAEL